MSRQYAGVSRYYAGAEAGLSMLALAATALAGAALVALVLVQAWQVFARYVLNDSPGWTEPIAQFLMNSAMMFGAAAGVRAQAHFGFFVGVQHAPPVLQRVLLAIGHLIAAGIGGVLAVWGGALLVDEWSVPMAGAALPQGMIFLPICVGGLLITVFALERLLAPPVVPGS